MIQHTLFKCRFKRSSEVTMKYIHIIIKDDQVVVRSMNGVFTHTGKTGVDAIGRNVIKLKFLGTLVARFGINRC